MTLTLANAAAVLDHQEIPPPGRGYVRTRHHAGYISPGDLWRPVADQQPHTVTAIHHHDGITLIDQAGNSYHYPANGLIPTAVADPMVIPPDHPR